MNPSTSELQNDGARSLLWVAGAVGVGLGIASWVYRRSRRSRWDTAKGKASQLFEYAREEVKPWMGIAAGTAAAGTAIAIYTRSRKQSASKRAADRAGEIVSQAGRSLRPWAGVAVNAAISLASAVYSQRARNEAKNAIRKGAQKSAADLANTGRGILRRLWETSEQKTKRYPRLRKLIA
jgi:hypothetical protein